MSSPKDAAFAAITMQWQIDQIRARAKAMAENSARDAAQLTEEIERVATAGLQAASVIAMMGETAQASAGPVEAGKSAEAGPAVAAASGARACAADSPDQGIGVEAPGSGCPECGAPRKSGGSDTRVWVPGMINAEGRLEIDPEKLVSEDSLVPAEPDDSAGFLGFDRTARLTRLRRRIRDLNDREPVDLYQEAAAQGLIQENLFNGLGNTTISASGTGSLTDAVNRNFWAKSMVLDSDSPDSILVTAFTIAGLPFQIGTKGTPLSMFSTNSTRYGISFGRKLALVGQQIVVNLTNIDSASPHNVTGGLIVDEMNPYMAAIWMERMLLSAALGMPGAPTMAP